MRTIDFTTLKETALILTFSPREKEMRTPLPNGYTRYHGCRCIFLAPKARRSSQPGAAPQKFVQRPNASAESAIHFAALSRAFSARMGSNHSPGAMPQAVLTLRLWRLTRLSHWEGAVRRV